MTMNKYTDHFENLTGAQREIFGPIVKMNKFAVDAYEKVARHNYNLAGDFVDFTIEQAQATAAADSVNGLLQQQVSAVQAFADLVGKRTSEYSVMTRDMFMECQDAVKSNIVEPVRRAGERYSDAAHEFQSEFKDPKQTKSNNASKKTSSRKKPTKKTATKKKSDKKTSSRIKPSKKTAPKKKSSKKTSSRKNPL